CSLAAASEFPLPLSPHLRQHPPRSRRTGRLSLRCWARSCLAASSKFLTIITHTRDPFPDLCWAEAMFLRKLADLVILRLEFTLATMAVTGMTGRRSASPTPHVHTHGTI